LATIPAELLQSLAATGGGQVALVIGAGCSVNHPTSIPLAGDLAEAVERQLVLNGRLQANQCPNPRDLAALASLIFQICNNQVELVQCFPIQRMRLARANLGYKLLVALMAEGAISHVLSLNFDLAVQNAAAELGVEIATVAAANEPVPIRAALVQLHGNANSEPDDLVLRTEVMDGEWIGQWHQVVAQQVLAAPTVLFAGLGSPAPVLTATVEMIQGALGGNKALYQADIVPFGQSGFAAQLEIPEQRYIQGSWDAVVARLAERIAAQQVDSLSRSGRALLTENHHGEADLERFTGIAAQLTGQSLLTLGKMRAFADLDRDKLYRPHSVRDDEFMSEPMLRLVQVAERFGLDTAPTPAGTWTLRRNGQPIAQIMLATGGGVRRMTAVESRAKTICASIAANASMPVDVVLIGGLIDVAPVFDHVDLIADENPDDIIGGLATPLLVSANDPDHIDRIGVLLHVA
jgi:hypothetical protein